MPVSVKAERERQNCVCHKFAKSSQSAWPIFFLGVCLFTSLRVAFVCVYACLLLPVCLFLFLNQAKMVEDGLVLAMVMVMSEQEEFSRLCATVSFPCFRP